MLSLRIFKLKEPSVIYGDSGKILPARLYVPLSYNSHDYLLHFKYGEEPHENAESHIHVIVEGPDGEQVPVERKHNNDGSFTVSYTPASVVSEND